MRVSVILKEEDRDQLFWESAFEALSFFGDLERTSACLEEVTKYEPGYECRKLMESAEAGEA